MADFGRRLVVCKHDKTVAERCEPCEKLLADAIEANRDNSEAERTPLSVIMGITEQSIPAVEPKPKRKLAVMFVPQDEIIELAQQSLDIPDGAVVRAVNYDYQLAAFAVTMEHESFPEHQPGCHVVSIGWVRQQRAIEGE